MNHCGIHSVIRRSGFATCLASCVLIVAKLLLDAAVDHYPLKDCAQFVRNSGAWRRWRWAGGTMSFEGGRGRGRGGGHPVAVGRHGAEHGVQGLPMQEVLACSAGYIEVIVLNSTTVPRDYELV